MSILDEIRGQLNEGALEGLAGRLGAGRGETELAVGTALPTILGGLARNANRSAEGAGALAAALDRDHDPSLLEQLGGALAGGGGGGLGSLLGGSGGTGGSLGDLLGAALSGSGSAPKALDGPGILRHILGERRSAVEAGVGRTSGLQSGQVSQLLTLLAPLVMSALAKVKRDRQLDPGSLAEALGAEQRDIEGRAPELGGLASLLDRDGDGEIADDLAGIGSSLAKAFFKR